MLVRIAIGDEHLVIFEMKENDEKGKYCDLHTNIFSIIELAVVRCSAKVELSCLFSKCIKLCRGRGEDGEESEEGRGLETHLAYSLSEERQRKRER